MFNNIHNLIKKMRVTSLCYCFSLIHSLLFFVRIILIRKMYIVVNSLSNKTDLVTFYKDIFYKLFMVAIVELFYNYTYFKTKQLLEGSICKLLTDC